MKHSYYVYIMSSYKKTLYVGVTNNILGRAGIHKGELVNGFTKKYHIKYLVYFEEYDDIRNAIAREKQIKKYRREKKIALIESINPEWKDLITGEKCCLGKQDRLRKE